MTEQVHEQAARVAASRRMTEAERAHVAAMREGHRLHTRDCWDPAHHARIARSHEGARPCTS
jgi:hypothetical protein